MKIINELWDIVQLGGSFSVVPLRSFRYWRASESEEAEDWEKLSQRVGSEILNPVNYPLPILPRFQVGWERQYRSYQYHLPGYFAVYGEGCIPGMRVGEQRNLAVGSQSQVAVGASVHVLSPMSDIVPMYLHSPEDLIQVFNKLHAMAKPFAEQYQLIQTQFAKQSGYPGTRTSADQYIEASMLRRTSDFLPRRNTLNLRLYNKARAIRVPAELDKDRPRKHLSALLAM